jgi:hypothetical protein
MAFANFINIKINISLKCEVQSTSSNSDMKTIVVGDFGKACTSVRDMHVAFQIRYVYNYITKLCRRQAEIIHNHENENVRNIAQGETPHRKHKRLTLGGCHLYDRSSV